MCVCVFFFLKHSRSCTLGFTSIDIFEVVCAFFDARERIFFSFKFRFDVLYKFIIFSLDSINIYIRYETRSDLI